MCKKKTIEQKNVNIKFNILRIHALKNPTYWLLYCKGHIQIANNHSTINVEKENNRVNKT